MLGLGVKCVCVFCVCVCFFFFFFQAEDGIRDGSPSRGLGDVYRRQGVWVCGVYVCGCVWVCVGVCGCVWVCVGVWCVCRLYTADAADDLLCVVLGGGRIIS